ncbi:hypothetical protein [Fortiea contorta]|uniref:hypothetical protein n=1 Tax=Fortiea contorta TaxID=1892405 RepID=UPI00034AB071|nr:hypothetical protein [Fortiea contorta]
MNPTPDSFEYWMEKIRLYWRNMAKPTADINSSLDDEEKLRWFIDIDRRHLNAIANKLPDKVNQQVLQEFIAILQEYKKLLQLQPPNYPLYKAEDLRDKIANVMEDIADVYCFMCTSDGKAGFDYKQANFYYHQAIQSYVENNSAETAKRCFKKIAQLRINYKINVDREIEHLFLTLESLSPHSLKYLETLINLAEIYFANGDNFEAEKCLLLTESKLKELGYTQFSLTEITNDSPILNKTQSRDFLEEYNSGEIAVKVRELYRRLYFSLSQIYREKAVQEAAKYLELVNRMNGDDKNKNPSEQMLNWLNSHFNL